MTIGRPTKYLPEYCDGIIEAGREGKSWTAFAAEIGVARSTINVWIAEFPEFSEAASRAKALAAAWYETAQRRIIQDGGSSSQATLVVFGMKNMGSDDWRDKQEVETYGKDGGPIQVAISARDRIADRLARLTPEKPASDDPSKGD